MIGGGMNLASCSFVIYSRVFRLFTFLQSTQCLTFSKGEQEQYGKAKVTGALCVCVLMRPSPFFPTTSRVVFWPRVVGKAIAEGTQNFPAPPSEGCSKERISSSNFEASKILWSVAWILLLFFVAWPLAYFLSWWWVVIMPFECMITARE